MANHNILGLWDFVLGPIYFGIIFLIALYIRNKNILIYPEFRYFTWGLVLKFIGALAFCMMYVYYYKGGDTTSYYKGAVAIANLSTHNFAAFWDILINNNLSLENLYSFNQDTGIPPRYMWRDPQTFAVCRYTALFALIGFRSFLVMSMLTACLSFIGLWKLYKLFNILYPGHAKGFAWTILFIPSMLFWGSGIMKDTYVLGAVCWVTYNFYMVFIIRKKLYINIPFLALNIAIIISLKPYVLLSLFPGMLFWLYFGYMKKITNPLMKILSFPFLITLIGAVGYLSFSNLSSAMGVYGDVDTAVKQAQIIQQDLLRTEAYGRNNYYLGEIDGSFVNMLKLAPAAVGTAIFRPMFWEIGSPTMVISALENTILLILTMVLLIKANPLKIIRIIVSEPILFYSLVFALLLAFGVGIAGTNFGALVRYKIPFIPFFFSMLYVIFIRHKKQKE